MALFSVLFLGQRLLGKNMKKLFVIILLVCCVGSAFAQKEIIKAGVAVSQSSKIAQTVSRMSAKQALNTARVLALQFVDLPGKGNNVPSFITLSPTQLQAFHVSAEDAVVYAQPGLLVCRCVGVVKDWGGTGVV